MAGEIVGAIGGFVVGFIFGFMLRRHRQISMFFSFKANDDHDKT